MKLFFINTLLNLDHLPCFVLVPREAPMTWRAPEAWLFDPSLPDGDLWTPCWSWDHLLSWIFSPGRCRKQALVTQWWRQPWRGPLLQSHGRLQGMMGPCELYFLTNFCFPRGQWSFHRTCLNHLEIRGRFTRLFYGKTFESNQPKKQIQQLSVSFNHFLFIILKMIYELFLWYWSKQNKPCQLSIKAHSYIMKKPEFHT